MNMVNFCLIYNIDIEMIKNSLRKARKIVYQGFIFNDVFIKD